MTPLLGRVLSSRLLLLPLILLLVLVRSRLLPLVLLLLLVLVRLRLRLGRAAEQVEDSFEDLREDHLAKGLLFGLLIFTKVSVKAEGRAAFPSLPLNR